MVTRLISFTLESQPSSSWSKCYNFVPQIKQKIFQFFIAKSIMFRAINNVTIIGKILPLWQNIQSLGQFLMCLFTNWQNFEPSLASFLHFWANFVDAYLLGQGPRIKRQRGVPDFWVASLAINFAVETDKHLKMWKLERQGFK